MVHYENTPKKDEIIHGRWNVARFDNCQWPGTFRTSCVKILGPAKDEEPGSNRIEIVNLQFVMDSGQVFDLWPTPTEAMQRSNKLNYGYRRKIKEERIQDVLNNCEPINKNSLGINLASFLSAFVRELEFAMTDRHIIEGIMASDDGLNGNACRTILRVYGCNSLNELTKRAALDFFDNSDRMRFESESKAKLNMIARKARNEAILKRGCKAINPMIRCHN